MVNKSLYISGIGLSLVVAWTMISEDTQEKIEISSKGTAQRDIKEEKYVVIEYNGNEKESLEVDKNKSVKKYIPEKYVETHAFDIQRKYEISLINPDQKDGFKSSRYIKLHGSIDKSSFEMMVPEHLIKENHNVMLRVKNLETEVIEETEATFLYELQDKNRFHNIAINSDAIYNFTYKSEKALLP